MKGFEPVNKLVMQLLGERLFVCELCSETYAYEGFESHYQNSCKKLTGDLKCPKCDQTGFGKDSLINHWMDSCPLIEIVCLVCEIQFQRTVFDEHDCIKALKQ